MRKYPTTSCPFCGKLISTSNIGRHIDRHINKPESFKPSKYKLNHEGTSCQFCGKLCKNRNSLCNHERTCKLNPNRQILIKSPLAHKRKGTPPWNVGLTKCTNASVLKLSQTLSNKYAEHILIPHQKGKPRTWEEKRKISETLRKNPHAGGLRYGSGRGKKGWYKGYFCDSTYELVWIIYNIDHNIWFERNKKAYIYEYKGKKLKYYPDFRLEDNSLVEIKGYIDEKVQIKLSAVKDTHIQLLTKEDLSYAFNWVRKNYVFKDLSDLYE